MRTWLGFLLVPALALAATAAWADPLRFGRLDVPSAFHIEKSENRNQVHYGVRLDAACMPVGAAPVFAYWRMLERGPGEVEPLAPHEGAAYGIAAQQVVSREGTGLVRIALRALPSREIVLETRPNDGECAAVASLRVAGIPAQLKSIFVKLRWPFGVDYILLSGVAERGGHAVTERITP